MWSLLVRIHVACKARLSRGKTARTMTNVAPRTWRANPTLRPTGVLLRPQVQPPETSMLPPETPRTAAETRSSDCQAVGPLAPIDDPTMSPKARAPAASIVATSTHVPTIIPGTRKRSCTRQAPSSRESQQSVGLVERLAREQQCALRVFLLILPFRAHCLLDALVRRLLPLPGPHPR